MMVVYIRAIRQDIPWTHRHPNSDQWVKKTGIVQFHVSRGKLYLFREDGSNTWFKLSEVARLAVEDDNIQKESVA